MGNQLFKGYSNIGQPIPGVGNNKIWKIFHGIRQSTNSQVTIFGIEKRNIKSSQRDEVTRFAKKEAMGLARLRHPGILAINETLIENEHVIAFSTQRVLGSLNSLYKERKLKEILSNQMELRLNLITILDTLDFLHNTVKTVHLAINMDNIYITSEGKWKIGGLSLSQIYAGEGLQNISDFKCDDLTYCAPEVALEQKFDRTADIYSLGVLVLDLLMIINDNFVPQTIKTSHEYTELNQKRLLKKINNQKLEKMENYQDLKLLLKTVLIKDPMKRATLSQFTNSKWLNDRLVLTVKYLQNITSYDVKQQIEFLKGLMGVLHDFNHKILLKRIFPTLMDYLKFKNLIPSILYICIEIAKDGKIINGSEFLDNIWPHLKKITQGKQMTAHSLYLFVNNIVLFEKVVSLNDVRETIVPLYIKCFECPAKLKDLALQKTQYMMSKMDYQFVKTKMIPKIMSCLKDSNLQIRKKSLIALRKSLKILDSQTIVSHVLPGLENCRKAGTDPFTNAITVFIYSELGKSLSTEVISSKLIPTILPYLIDPSVTRQDFFSYKKTMVEMFEKIEKQRQKYWEQNEEIGAKVYSQKDFQFHEPQQQKETKPIAEIGKGNFNFLSDYNTQPKTKENVPERQVFQNRTSTVDHGFSFGAQQKVSEPAANLQKAQEADLKIDFGALNFKQQQKQFNDPFSITFESSPKSEIPQKLQFPQAQSQTNSKKLIGPSMNKPIKQSPPMQYNSNSDPFADLQKKNTGSDPFSFGNYQQQKKNPEPQMGNMSNLNSIWDEPSFSPVQQPPQNTINFNAINTNQSSNTQKSPFDLSSPSYDDPFAQIEKGSQVNTQNIPSYQAFNMGNQGFNGEKTHNFGIENHEIHIPTNQNSVSKGGMKKPPKAQQTDFNLLL